jgi:hypothetical protein
MSETATAMPGPTEPWTKPRRLCRCRNRIRGQRCGRSVLCVCEKSRVVRPMRVVALDAAGPTMGGLGDPGRVGNRGRAGYGPNQFTYSHSQNNWIERPEPGMTASHQL